MEEENKKHMNNAENLPEGAEETTREAAEGPSFDAEAFSDDDLGVDIPDIPLPSEGPPEDKVEDKFEAAYKFAIVGVGQGGSRLAETFWKLGYRRVAVINTAPQDLKSVKVPVANKLLVGGKGAGKDRKVAEDIFKESREDILDFLKRTFKGGFDRALVCLGAGGGTGAGGGPLVIDIVHDLCKTYGIENADTDARVGAVVALPTRAEGSKVQSNAKQTAQALIDKGRPVRRFHLDSLTEETLGALLMHFMLEVILAADLLGLNAFDQPAVEHGKSLARHYLGKFK